MSFPSLFDPMLKSKMTCGAHHPAANAGLPDRLFKRHGCWVTEVAKNGNVQDCLSSRCLSFSKALGI